MDEDGTPVTKAPGVTRAELMADHANALVEGEKQKASIPIPRKVLERAMEGPPDEDNCVDPGCRKVLPPPDYEAILEYRVISRALEYEGNHAVSNMKKKRGYTCHSCYSTYKVAFEQVLEQYKIDKAQFEAEKAAETEKTPEEIKETEEKFSQKVLEEWWIPNRDLVDVYAALAIYDKTRDAEYLDKILAGVLEFEQKKLITEGDLKRIMSVAEDLADPKKQDESIVDLLGQVEGILSRVLFLSHPFFIAMTGKPDEKSSSDGDDVDGEADFPPICPSCKEPMVGGQQTDDNPSGFFCPDCPSKETETELEEATNRVLDEIQEVRGPEGFTTDRGVVPLREVDEIPETVEEGEDPEDPDGQDADDPAA